MGQRLYLGMPTVVESHAEHTPFAAVFEDDGETAYFYALDTRLTSQPILDAVHVYNVGVVLDHGGAGLDVHVPSEVEIVWSGDETRVALVIDGYPHAAFDFKTKRAYSRSNFPPGSRWSSAGHAWDDGAVDFLPRVEGAP